MCDVSSAKAQVGMVGGNSSTLSEGGAAGGIRSCNDLSRMQPVDRSETNRSQEELSHPVVAFQAPPGLCLLGLRKFMQRTIASTGFFDPRQLLALSSLGRFLALFALAAAMTGPGLASAAPIWEPRNVVVGPARRWGAGIAFDGAAGNSILFG